MSPDRKWSFFGLCASAALLLSFLISTRAYSAKIDPERVVMKNGMTLLVLGQPSLPIVTIQALMKTGSVFDPPEKAGLANMTAALLDEGTSFRTSKEIAEMLDFVGARLTTRTSKDYTTLQLRLLRKDIDLGFDLLSDILMNPVFDIREINRAKKQIKGEIRSEKDQPGAIANRAFQEAIFGNHPYRTPVVGRVETIPNITLEDLLKFYEKYYLPNNTIISIAGDLTGREAEQIVRLYFGRWKKKSIAFPNISVPNPIQENKIKRIDKDLTQASIILGHLGIHRANPDYYAVLVMNYILGGGGFSSRMMTDIRDDNGLVYSIYSHFSAKRFPGSFSVRFQTKNSSANEAIRSVFKQIRNIQATKVTDRELSEAKSYLTGSFPLRIDTTRKMARLLSAIEYHQLGLDYFETYVEKINLVTREDVLRVAKQYLHPERSALVVVGKQSAIDISIPVPSGIAP